MATIKGEADAERILRAAPAMSDVCGDSARYGVLRGGLVPRHVGELLHRILVEAQPRSRCGARVGGGR
ncbi:hypothetical protein N802_03635 [Knoellia sinensis KCTC 19936]|uniref:Uncharacterized protein n=1 Tax=Knoellia sinensis KCTC 19936 TaxID=1385520 RepID=A0A0A0J2V4_9MICO|nr:hypothetical protein N802_03635 [Knoellia sinensis KCTC 19936]